MKFTYKMTPFPTRETFDSEAESLQTYLKGNLKYFDEFSRNHHPTNAMHIAQWPVAFVKDADRPKLPVPTCISEYKYRTFDLWKLNDILALLQS